jgi:hypothetical protein
MVMPADTFAVLSAALAAHLAAQVDRAQVEPLLWDLAEATLDLLDRSQRAADCP